MKRIALTCIVFLLIGAVVNVAVAWGCSLLIDIYGPDRPIVIEHRWRQDFLDSAPPAPDGYQWLEFVDLQSVGQHGAMHIGVRRARIRAPSVDSFAPRFWPETARLAPRAPGFRVPSGDFVLLFESHADTAERADEGRLAHLSGFPMHSLWCDLGGDISARSHLHEHHHQLDQKTIEPSGVIVTSLQPWRGGQPRVLPLRPIWSGFLINTLVYASLTWLLFCGPFVARRVIRDRRGRCRKCGYDLRETTSDTCPECGTSYSDGHRISRRKNLENTS